MDMIECKVCHAVKAGYLFRRGSDECDVCRAVRMDKEVQEDRRAKEAEWALHK